MGLYDREKVICDSKRPARGGKMTFLDEVRARNRACPTSIGNRCQFDCLEEGFVYYLNIHLRFVSVHTEL